MKDPNWHVRKRLSHPPRNVRAQMECALNRPPGDRIPYKTLREFVAEAPPLPPVKKPELPWRMVQALFERSAWGGTFAGRTGMVRVALRCLGDTLARGISSLTGKLAEHEKDGEEVWQTVLRAFAKDIGLDIPEALAFVDRGETADGKTARLRALVAAFDLGGRDAAIALVFSDLAQVA